MKLNEQRVLKLAGLINEANTNEVTIAGKKFLSNFSKKIGFTSIKIKNGQLIINHSGNMGNSIERSVDPNIDRVGLPTISKLKKMYKVVSEKGSPDYAWTIIFDIK